MCSGCLFAADLLQLNRGRNIAADDDVKELIAVGVSTTTDEVLLYHEHMDGGLIVILVE